jgi:outer membrane receptor protein involved in Fe transport
MPSNIVNFELSYYPEHGLGGRISLQHEGKRVLNDNPAFYVNGNPNIGTIWRTWPSRTNVDLQLFYKINDQYKVSFIVDNVFNRRYYLGTPTPNAWGDFSYTLRPLRTFFLGLEMNWDRNS